MLFSNRASNRPTQNIGLNPKRNALLHPISNSLKTTKNKPYITKSSPCTEHPHKAMMIYPKSTGRKAEISREFQIDTQCSLANYTKLYQAGRIHTRNQHNTIPMPIALVPQHHHWNNLLVFSWFKSLFEANFHLLYRKSWKCTVTKL